MQSKKQPDSSTPANSNPASYEVVYSARRTLALAVGSDGRLLIRAPRGTPDWYIRDFVQEKQDWIRKQQARLADAVWLPDLDEQETEACREQTRRLARNWLAGWSGPQPSSLRIHNQKSRWGSCSSKGTLSLNLRLCLLPRELFDYIMLHELAHLTEMNHSTRFWALVEARLPDYKRRRKELKRYHFRT